MVRVGAGAFSAVTHPYASRNNPTVTTISTARMERTRAKKSVVSSISYYPTLIFFTAHKLNTLFFPLPADFHGSTFLVTDWYGVLNNTQLQAGFPQPDVPLIEINSTCRKSLIYIITKLQFLKMI